MKDISDEKLNNEKDLCLDVPVGNTDTTVKCKGGNACYRWCFTLKADYKDNSGIDVPIVPKSLHQILSRFCKEFYFQLEFSEGGYKHYQGVFSLNDKHRLNEVKNIIGFDTVHLERVKNWCASIRYCQKEATRVGIPYNHNSSFIRIISELRPWQAGLERKLLEEPDDRSITWIYDSLGNIGKTVFCKYMAVKWGAKVLNNGSFSNIAYVIDEDTKIVLFNFSRTVEGVVNYSALESIKDGLIFSGKYECKIKIFNCPHVIVLANFAPNTSALSADRWDIINLADNKYYENV